MVIHRLVNLDTKLVEKFIGFVKHLRADIEGMMQTAILLDSPDERFFAFTE
jgi:hypothetical protein